MILRSLFIAMIVALGVQSASAQPFAITALSSSTSASVAPGGTLSVAAQSIGSATPIRITVSYRGSTSASITSINRLGSNDFSVAPISVPLLLASGSSFTTTVTFVPTSGQTSSGSLIISYVEGSGAGAVPSSFGINISGTAPDLAYSYAFSGGSAQAASDGTLIQYPTTAVNATRSLSFTITNRGSAAANVPNISLLGTAFQLGGLEIPPYTINTNTSFGFTVTFAPSDRSQQNGTLMITFANKTYAFPLQGTGTAASYTYTIQRADGTIAAVQVGQSIPFPNTNVGGSTVATLNISNTGNGPGTITAISAVGAGFQLTNTPFLPLTLVIGAQAQLTLTFAPTASGDLSGALRVGDDTFGLTGTGVGPLLAYLYTSGATVNPIQSGGSILFPPTQIGGSGQVHVTVTNTGNASSGINTIFLTGSNAFTLSGVQSLPFNLAPNSSTGFDLTFKPGSIGVSQGNLQIGSAIFPISGFAAAPDPLPPVVLSGPSGQSAPLQQPTYQLTLKQPYSIDLTGTLNVSFNSDAFASDPSVQFATGGKAVTFFIAAGTTNAKFANNSNSIAIQTGTVAGTIQVFPTFATTTGTDLTPSSIPTAVLTVPPSAPQITNLSISNQTASGFTLSITGYSSSRSVTQLALTMTPAAGQNLTNNSITIPVDSAFQSWYQTTSSQSAGSAFTAALPITLTGNSSAPSQLTKAIQSIAITLTNAQGASSPQSVTVP